MGTIVAILGEAGDHELSRRLEGMLVCSRHRGQAESLVEGPLAIGIQSLGSDASLAEHGNWIVAFHGYIGNWAELSAERDLRIEDGASNAESIASAYEDLGERLFAKLRGEWAVLIWNRREGTLLAARDVVGCRPLFVHRHGTCFFLATEIRQVLAGSGAGARCRPAAVADIHLVRFPAAGRTVFEGVERVPGGVLRTFGVDGDGPAPNDLLYWSPPATNRNRRDSRGLVEEVRELIDTAVARAAPENGAAVSLSGGMDSSSVWGSLAQRVGRVGLHSRSFWPYSNSYPGMACDETPFIRSIHEFTGVDGTLIDTSAMLASDYLDELCDRIDHPHMPNALPVELVCEAAAADGHTVLLTGLGGDEWLGGSLDYIRDLFYSGKVFMALHDLWRVRLPRRLGKPRQRAMWLTPQIGLVARLSGRGAVRASAREAIIRDEYRQSEIPIEGSWSKRLRNWGLPRSKTFLVRCLDHLASGQIFDFIEQQGAWHGIDIRHPLMDLDIMEFAFSVDPRALVGGRCHKWLVRQAMADRLPSAVTERIETTVFNEIFTRETDIFGEMPPAIEWALGRLGVLDTEAVDRFVADRSNQEITFELIRLWWIEVFVARIFAPTAAVL